MIANAEADDLVRVADKGNEDHQILGTEKVHFDDREQAQLAWQRGVKMNDIASIWWNY